jgi:beta-glucanase (GH16 family)
MKKISYVLILSALSLVLVACKSEEAIVEVEEVCETFVEVDESTYEFELIYEDNFDTFNEEVWNYETGGNGFGNNELQYYTEGENLTVEDGILTITARLEDYQGRNYTSSKITTKGNIDVKYAKIEVMAKLPAGRGTWPAIWMMPTKNSYGGWPKSGEIDIMEHVGFNPEKVVGTIHTDAYNHMKNTQKGKTISAPGALDEFHLYSIEWLPNSITWYLDGKKYFTYRPTNILDCPNYTQWPFDHEFYLIINQAIGGDWGGAQGVDDAIFPTTFEIDYVKIYQAKVSD